MSANRPTTRLWLLLVAGALLLIAAIHTAHFYGYNYRQDEAWVVHGVLSRDLGAIMDWMQQGTAPPGYTLFLDAWVQLTGHAEASTRFSSTLFTLLGLAFLYRLMADWFAHRAALATILVLGLWSFYQFHSHEARPYGALLCFLLMSQWALNRWLRTPHWRYALLFVVGGILATYMHYYAILALFTLGLYVAFFVRWWRLPYLHLLAYFSLIALAILPWFSLVFRNSRTADAGIDYALSSSNLAETWGVLYDFMQTDPQALGVFLLLVGIAAPTEMLLKPLARIRHSTSHTNQQALRPGQARRDSLLNENMHLGWHPGKAQLIFFPVAVSLLALLLNERLATLTPRNLIIILPSLAALMGYGLSSLGMRPLLIGLVLFLIPSLTSFRAYVSNGPYREVAAVIETQQQPGSLVVVEAPAIWQHIPLIYYLREESDLRLQNDELLHFAAPGQERAVSTMPTLPLNLIQTADTLPQSSSTLSLDAEQLWWIEVADGVGTARLFRRQVEADYIPYRSTSFAPPEWDWPHTVTQFRRIPEDAAPLYAFGEVASLDHWSLETFSVRACESFELETWWMAQAPLPQNYSMTAVLVDANGSGIVNSDGAPGGILTGLWETERYYLDERSLTVPCDLQAGSYSLLVGLYDPATVETLPVTTAAGDPVNGLAYLTNIEVLP